MGETVMDLEAKYYKAQHKYNETFKNVLRRQTFFESDPSQEVHLFAYIDSLNALHDAIYSYKRASTKYLPLLHARPMHDMYYAP